MHTESYKDCVHPDYFTPEPCEECEMEELDCDAKECKYYKTQRCLFSNRERGINIHK